MRCLHAALKRKPGRRSGLTLLEVMIALAVFLVGSVGIIALFVAASVLHVDASNRRTASFIAHDLLAEVRGMRYRDVFATTTLRTDINKETANVPAERTSADAIHWAANFDRYPWNRTLHTTSSGGSMPTSRNNGIILIDNEWIWYRGFAAAPVQFVSCTRGVAGSVRAAHTAGARIFQPKTWYYVLDADLEEPPANPPPDITSVSVLGNPNSLPMPPEQGFIVLDDEWIRYTSWDGNRGHFYWNDSREDRGFGGTQATGHLAGTPVTVAQEHNCYPGFYYAVQLYPVNATGGEAHLVISVGYGAGGRFRAHTFRSIHSPAAF